ncbi:MAG: myristoyl transferase [Candidatus Atribacteria bacterium]|nr:MAG: myristoyl transferase [Candidatus Atribacteria bacterium]
MNAKTQLRASMLLIGVAAIVMGITFLSYAADDEITVALKWLPQTQFAGYYVADEMGFYEDEGLSVTILPGGGAEPQDLVASGEAQFGVTWMGILLAARDQGIELVNIAQIFQSSGFRMIAWADSGIVRPADLRDQSIEVWYGGNEVPLLALLEKYGLNPESDLMLQSQAFDMNAFLSRSVAASAAMSYNELNVVRQAIVGAAVNLTAQEVLALSAEAYAALEAMVNPDEQLTVFDVNDEGVAMLEDMIFASEAFLASESNRDIAARFVRASLRGWEYARDHHNEAVNILLAQDESGSMSRLHQSLMLDAVVEVIWGSGRELGYLEPSLFEQTADIALEFGVISQPASGEAYSHDIWEMAIGN